jgi:hypothetical protein
MSDCRGLGSLWWPSYPLGYPQAWGPLPMRFGAWPQFSPVAQPFNACPLTPLVGACCSGCAEGKGCSGESEIKQAAAEIQGTAGVGELPGWSEKALPWSKVEEFDAEVRKLDTDVRAKGNPGMQFAWQVEVLGFWPRWRAWFDATKESWFNLFGGMAITGPTLKAFEDYRHEFNSILQQFKAAGLQTGTEAIDTTDKSPVEQGLEEGGKGLGEGVGTALSTLGQGIVYLGLFVALGAGLYLGGPVLVRRLAR